MKIYLESIFGIKKFYDYIKLTAKIFYEVVQAQ